MERPQIRFRQQFAQLWSGGNRPTVVFIEGGKAFRSIVLLAICMIICVTRIQNRIVQNTGKVKYSLRMLIKQDHTDRGKDELLVKVIWG